MFLCYLKGDYDIQLSQVVSYYHQHSPHEVPLSGPFIRYPFRSQNVYLYNDMNINFRM